jgi:hypothetical protein
MSQDPQRSRPRPISPLMECFHTRTSSLLLTSLSVTVMHGLAAGGHIHVLLSVVPQGGGSATSTNAYCGAANGHVVWLLWLRPVSRDLTGPVCQETSFFGTRSNGHWLLTWISNPPRGHACTVRVCLSLHWHAPLTFQEPLLPQDSPTAHSACSTPLTFLEPLPPSMCIP